MQSSPPPAAGGALVAFGVLIGAGIGFSIGQATPGALIGLATGIAVAGLIWWRDHRRTGR